jgi:signal transduction histidine kinase
MPSTTMSAFSRRHRFVDKLLHRWNNLSLRIKGFAIVAIPLAPLLTTAVLLLVTERQQRQAQELVGHTLQVKTEIATMSSLLGDGETGTRGFLLTRSPESLLPYENAAAKLPTERALLAALIADNPAQMKRLETVQALIEARPVSSLVTYARSHPISAVPTELLRQSRTVMTALRLQLSEMNDAEDALLEGRVATASRARGQLAVVTIAGTVLGVLGGIVGVWAFAAGITRRLEDVSRNASRLAHGEPPVPVMDADDEVGVLTRRLAETGLLMARHVDEQKHAAEHLQRTLTDLQTSNHELEAFSYSVSHDLRAPLRHITGFATMLARATEHPLDETGQRYLNTIIESATRMGRLIDDLLAFSRMGRTNLEKESVHLADVVRTAQREVEATAIGRHITWAVHPLPDVDADPAMLLQVIVNLLSNAVKYTAGRGPTRIEIGSTTGTSQDEITIFVRDNGVGFDMKYAHKLFGVFQRLHSSDEFEGTGIGLANVRRIIHRHGGRTWAEGAVNAGATFFFSLPVSQGVAIHA